MVFFIFALDILYIYIYSIFSFQLVLISDAISLKVSVAQTPDYKRFSTPEETQLK